LYLRGLLMAIIEMCKRAAGANTSFGEPFYEIICVVFRLDADAFERGAILTGSEPDASRESADIRN